MLSETLLPYYKNLGKTLCKSLFSVLAGMLNCCSSNTSEIARSMGLINKKSFNTNDKAISYLYRNKNFQVDDKFWRCYINMIFAMFKEQNYVKKGEQIFIQVDFTSDTDDFLILCASIRYKSRAIPLYFSMRNYPKKPGQYNHKKMELAFLKALKHALPVTYSYVIVADRGFGNNRFMDYCKECGFEYLIRMQPNMNVEYQGKYGILRDVIKQNGSFEILVDSWDKNIRLFRNEKQDKIWFLASNIKGLKHSEALSHYEDRFKIEKCFQDLKSSGFDIEKSKIKKYDRLKRMLVMCMISHSLMVMVGAFVAKHRPAFKKKFPIHTSLISLSLPWLKELFPYSFSEL